MGKTTKSKHLCQRGADRDVFCQRLCNFGTEFLVGEIPRGDLTVRAVAQSVKDGSPARDTELVAAQFALRQRGADTEGLGDRPDSFSGIGAFTGIRIQTTQLVRLEIQLHKENIFWNQIQ